MLSNEKILNYYLPDDRIARFPTSKRDNSKLLIYKNNCIEESVFSFISNFIPENTLLIFNDTQVIQARFLFKKHNTIIEIFCIEPIFPSDYTLSFNQRISCIWLCLIRNAKRWKNNCMLSCNLNANTSLTVQKLKQTHDGYLVKFTWNDSNLTFANILEQCGYLPLPPYLKRKFEEHDKENYQTIYANTKGSVAAPTAGLHFTNDVFYSLEKKHILIDYLTLHIGAGTFRPIKSKIISDHKMHAEHFFIKKKTIEFLIKYKQVFAVGTTSVRVIESLYYIGLILGRENNVLVSDINIPQWMPCFIDEAYISPQKALENIIDYMNIKKINVLSGTTKMLIMSGYKFKIVKGIITNFHQPRSTLLLLISAFIGEEWQKIYDYALQNGFRFLSYGDSSLLIP
ncbi:MAG: S-adenosylmethionine:tRNA ribosyltransferase-isomerase [Bacteroidales bacterium OttesenSCG-928-I14]|jgi:S-adenosylmethionine:tRNA ribosyltransferase-isomerase|nr:S-adenosylmethionine:tRNA ribosyltransferase-isomerase [Bacteroidales bacterium OttesenSCG-928-I14]